MDARIDWTWGTTKEAEAGLRVESGHMFISLPGTLTAWAGLRMMALPQGHASALLNSELTVIVEIADLPNSDHPALPL